MGSMHNTRILRFLIVLSAVVVTIFIYASYSTSTSLTPPPHMRAVPGSGAGNPSAAAYQQFALSSSSASMANGNSSHSNKNNSIEERSVGKVHAQPVNGINEMGSSSGLGVNKGNKKSMMVNARKLHREPTIDADADGGSGKMNVASDAAVDDADLERFINNDVLEEQYVQSVDNTLGNINNSVIGVGSAQLISAVSHQRESPQQQQQISLTGEQNQATQQQDAQQQLNKIPDSDVLIPTSNLQKFIENADKILKNMTSSPTTVNAGNIVSEKDPALAINLVEEQSRDQERNHYSDHEQEQQQEQQQKEHQQAEEKVQQTQNKEAQNQNQNDKENEIDTDEALPPSVVMTIKRGSGSGDTKVVSDKEALKKKKTAPTSSGANGTSKLKTTVKKSISTPKMVVDPTQGIPTRDIYERGHLNEEINIEQICPNDGTDLRVLILITSAQDHAQARLSIRQTWGHYGVRRDVSMAFILGRTTNETVNEMLSKENYIYGDLIRGNFIDSYNNLTLKTISALEWVDEHCTQAKYVLKTDDDMFINVPRLLAFLDMHAKDKRVIFGRLAKKWKPIRNKKSKYYVSTGQFSAAIFPPFTTGPAYVLSSDIVHDLYMRALNEVYLKLEDVFTTGIVAQQLNIKRVHAYEFLNRRISFNPCNLRKAISVHMIKSNEQFDLWKKLLDQTTRCK